MTAVEVSGEKGVKPALSHLGVASGQVVTAQPGGFSRRSNSWGHENGLKTSVKEPKLLT